MSSPISLLGEEKSKTLYTCEGRHCGGGNGGGKEREDKRTAVTALPFEGDKTSISNSRTTLAWVPGSDEIFHNTAEPLTSRPVNTVLTRSNDDNSPCVLKLLWPFLCLAFKHGLRDGSVPARSLWLLASHASGSVASKRFHGLNQLAVTTVITPDVADGERHVLALIDRPCQRPSEPGGRRTTHTFSSRLDSARGNQVQIAKNLPSHRCPDRSRRNPGSKGE